MHSKLSTLNSVAEYKTTWTSLHKQHLPLFANDGFTVILYLSAVKKFTDCPFLKLTFFCTLFLFKFAWDAALLSLVDFLKL